MSLEILCYFQGINSSEKGSNKERKRKSDKELKAETKKACLKKVFSSLSIIGWHQFDALILLSDRLG